MQEQLDQLQAQIDQINSGLGTSSDLSRDDETTLRERLGIGATVQAFPVGSVYIATVATNPSTLLGYGTWSVFGTGQVLVGLNAGDPNFGHILDAGGEKTHTISTTEMPAHTHTETIWGSAGSNVGGQASNGSSNLGTITSSSTGGGGAHNNLQPFITVQMWLRTA
jgi:hypothetical protein